MTDPMKTRLAVIGGGPGGYAAAFRAADLGLETTLIDLEPNPGGTCLFRGCIPSKALLHAAKVINDTRDARQWGITFGEPQIDLDKMRAQTQDVVSKMTGGLGQLSKARNINYIQGRASFEDSNTLHITSESGQGQWLHFEHAILASGSRPALIESMLVDSPRVMTSTDALEIQSVPETMLVIGGGYIGLELGSVYAALGAQVTVAEMTGSLLPGADGDLVEILAKRMNSVMEEILLSTRVVDMKEVANGVAVTFEGADGKAAGTRTFEQVLMAIGRRANSSGVGLRSTKVEVDNKGFVVVDEQRRTTDESIFAIGDVAGEPMLAHKASHEGRIAAEVVAGEPAVYEPQAIPAVVFTDPEVAWCGLSEKEAESQGREVAIARFPWGASGRATTIGRTDGLTKIITEPGSERILGMGIVGSGAGELIAEAVLAIEMGATASDIGMSIHAHPTLSETVQESADLIFGRGTHVYRPKGGQG
jgi:dihydrolipoyl dehydrogenase